jgi:hypothetical protein
MGGEDMKLKGRIKKSRRRGKSQESNDWKDSY